MFAKTTGRHPPQIAPAPADLQKAVSHVAVDAAAATVAAGPLPATAPTLPRIAFDMTFVSPRDKPMPVLLILKLCLLPDSVSVAVGPVND